MGWSGGTAIFDSVCRHLLRDEHIHIRTKSRVLKSLIEELWNQDWDTIDESSYFEVPYIKRILYELRPTEFEEPMGNWMVFK